MKYGHLWFFSILITVWLIVPVFAPVDRVLDSGQALQSSVYKVQQREEQGGKGVYSYDSELFRTPEFFREDKTDNSNKSDSRSYSEFLGPSFDNPSIKDESPKPDSWWNNQSSGDPMVKDLSRKDGGGFSSEGNGAGVP